VLADTSCSASTSRDPRSSSTRTPRQVSTSISPSRERRSRRGDSRRPPGGLARMARPQSRFVCQSCGESFLRWEGQCRACDGWNTLVETVVRETTRSERAIARGRLRGSRPGTPRSASPRPTCRVCASGSMSSTGSSAAVSSRARSCWSVASRGSASPRSCSRRRPASPGPRVARCCTRPARSRPGQVRLRAARLGLLSGPAGSAVQRPGRARCRADRRDGTGAATGAGRRRLDPDGDRRRSRGRGRAASARSANRRCA
jgi:hypothetical protein